MIKMTRGTYGVKEKGATVAKTKRSAPFSLSAKEEKRLVDAGVAVYVEPEKTPGKQPSQKPGASTNDQPEENGTEG